MRALLKGRYAARLAETDADIRRAQELRFLAFIAGTGAARDGLREEGRDADDFDMRLPACPGRRDADRHAGGLFPHVAAVERGRDRRELFGAILQPSALADFQGPMVEMGRFCIHPDWHDPDILRVAWGAMTRFVDDEGVEMLFGCSSFHGTEAEAYLDAFAVLRERHLAPKRWLPRVKAPNVFRFARALRRFRPDAKRAMQAMPPLLRTYLLMGGWVSDHAVVDRDLNTLHVFTGLEIRAIPPARARLLRGVAG